MNARLRSRALLLLLTLWTLATEARAEPPWSPASLRASRALTLAKGLESELRTLPALRDARVEVSLPDALAQVADAPPKPPRVVVWLTPRADFSSRDTLSLEVQALARRELSAAGRADVTLHWLDVVEAQPPALQRVGPFRVEPGSAGALRAVLLALLAATFALSALLLRYLERGRRSPPG